MINDISAGKIDEKILEIMMSEKNGIKKDQDVDIIQKKIDELTK